MRHDNRTNTQLRPIKITRHYTKHAGGSVLIQTGDTMVLCTATIENRVPPFLKGTGSGWLTAEYDMLPTSTHDRKRRAVSRGKQDGRTLEIQRLIGRSLRQSIDLTVIGERTIWVDCDVLQADGGTRTASINGAYIAVCDLINNLMKAEDFAVNPIISQVAAISVGIVNGQALLDLCYVEDSAADVDMNVVMDQNLDIIEIQGTGEGRAFNKAEFDKLYDLARAGIAEIIKLQKDSFNL